LKQFFDHLGLQGENLDQQGQAFSEKARENNSRQWIQEQITLYIEFHKRRVYETKELAPGTVKNLYRPIKTFYEAHDDLPTINWNWIGIRIRRRIRDCITLRNINIKFCERNC
jgi:hypothetical protein